MKFKKRIQNNHDYMNSDFIAMQIYFRYYYKMACVMYFSNLFENINSDKNSFVFYQIYYSKMIRMPEDDVLYGAKG